MTATDDSATAPVDSLFAWFREMHERNPVHHDDEYGWQLFRHADITRVLTDPKTFSSDTVRLFNRPQADLDLFLTGNLVTNDPPHHRKLRQVISQAFTPRVVAVLSDRIGKTVDALLDGVSGAGSFDLIDAVAYPLPIIVVAEMLGLPAEDVPLYRAWGDALGALDAATVPPEVMENEVAPAIREMNEYILGHVRRRRANPSDDLLGVLTRATIDGEPLRDGYLIGLVGLTLFAGHAASMALIGNAILTLDRHPEAFAAVRRDRALLPGAIEELMRLYPPFSRMARVTTAETELGGHPVGRGELVTLWVGAANRDAVRFPDPDRFDLHRATGGHLAFGQGVHFCLGAPLARLEVGIALNALFDRFDHIAVDHPAGVEFENPMQIICPRRLPVRVSG
ncbi:cytochrome P450 [Actinosynnema sp. NPDC047251]|uniref:Putative cytochrome P450 n=1 Tax=Saccharothrix espanaensis (strain ATCC 51144 / DSM 44229 / JCM 9112 / NBRC 15066 / NRRL 15764) TaxID=1179773 RepID=K0K331_SACES|nr:cytochrome P450 [Saccharothrix espanaensis]CCH31997.1 putative cytochrome P450 [Saccharothrix espanaensis DSM 44229]